MEGGEYHIEGAKWIRLKGVEPLQMRQGLRDLVQAIKDSTDLDWQVSASFAVPEKLVGIDLAVDPQTATSPEGYDLIVSEKGVRITGHDPAGLFYGICTLRQLLSQFGTGLPGLFVRDWPDFPNRGVMLDISRDKVYTMETLYHLVDLLSGWKVNQLQLYMEHTFAYSQHQEVWAQASPMTAQEILDLDAYCQERFIELVPNQNSLGHLRRWLLHPRYAPLAEIQGPFQSPWGPMEGPFSLCPVDPKSLEFVRSLYDELLAHFSSRKFNVGLDEPVDVGQGRSKAACEAYGDGRVYLNYLMDIYCEAERRGFSTQAWGDMIIQYPKLMKELPTDITILEWGYEAEHPFNEHAAVYTAEQIPFYVCPGTSSWNSITGRTSNALANLKSAAENGLAFRAAGYLNTDWGDNGHWQPLPISYLGFAAGAAYSWAYQTNKDMDIQMAISRFAFHDPSGEMGQAAYALGEIYRAFDYKTHNSSPLFWILQMPAEVLKKQDAAQANNFDRAEQAINLAAAPIERSTMQGNQADLVRQEYQLAVRLLRHAVQRGRWTIGITPGSGSSSSEVSPDALLKDIDELMDEFTRVWLWRNRRGGLSDSLARFEIARHDYQSAQ